MARVVEVARAVSFDAQPGESDPVSYYGELLSPDASVRARAARREAAYMADVISVAKLSGLDGLDVLEVGSGYGLTLGALACVGARRVHGLEWGPTAVEWARRWIDALPPDLGGRIVTEAGDAGAMPYEDERFDVLLSLEAISHYLDYRPFLAEAWRVLRPGGVLIISDGNNGLNPLTRRRTVALWASHEQPPDSPRRNPDSPFHFVDKRMRIVTETCPQLTRDEALLVALRTSGMIRHEVAAAACRYAADNVMPDSPYRRGRLTVHPTNEMVMERLFNPYALARELREHGFRTRVRGHWAGATPRRSLRLANRALAALTPVTIVAARAFRIAAWKPGSPADRAMS